jgi:hypothetical protein
MLKWTEEEKLEKLEKHRLDLKLDQELEDTFPASDALKITLSGHDKLAKPGLRRDSL